MYLFSIGKDNRLTEVRERAFSKERELQRYCEKSLDLIFGLQFVKSEFALNKFRIDTLAYDAATKSFVIIEYKKDKNFSVIDQGYAYLSLLLNNKADFILEYNENMNESLKRGDVDWSQSKILFVSTTFTNYQRESINFKDLPIELWEVKRFDNDTLSLSQLKPAGATESIKTISNKNEDIAIVSDEIKVYTEEDHLQFATDEMKELYDTLKQAVLNMGDISLNPTKLYIGFTMNKKNIVDVHILKKSLKIWINLKKGEIDDPKGLARDVSSIGHWGNGDYEIQISDDEDLEYLMSLIKQSYKGKA